MFEYVATVAQRFRRSDSGATAIEYGLIVGIIGLGIIAAANTISTSLDSSFTNASTELNTATAAG